MAGEEIGVLYPLVCFTEITLRSFLLFEFYKILRYPASLVCSCLGVAIGAVECFFS